MEVAFTHTHQQYFAGSGVIIQLSQGQKGNPELSG